MEKHRRKKKGALVERGWGVGVGGSPERRPKANKEFNSVFHPTSRCSDFSDKACVTGTSRGACQQISSYTPSTRGGGAKSHVLEGAEVHLRSSKQRTNSHQLIRIRWKE